MLRTAYVLNGRPSARHQLPGVKIGVASCPPATGGGMHTVVALGSRLIVDRRCSTRAIALVGGVAATCVVALLIVAGGAACGRAPDGGALRSDPARAGVTPLPSTPVPTGPAPAPEPWPQYRGDAGKTGYTRSSTNFAVQPQVLWQVPFLDRVGELGPALAEASPVVGRDGTIYLGTLQRGTAADPANGGFASFRPDGSPGPLSVAFLWRGVRAAAAVRDDGVVAFVSYGYEPVEEDFRFVGWRPVGDVAFFGPDGRQRRTVDLFEGGTGTGSPTLDVEGNLYHWDKYLLRKFSATLGTSDIAHTGVELSGGGVLSPTGTITDHPDPNTLPVEPLLPSAAYSRHCRDLVLTGAEGTLRVRAAGEGHWTQNVLWTSGAHGATTPAIGDGGRAYILTTNRGLEAWDQDGTRVWRVSLYGDPTAPPALGHGRRDPGDSSFVRCGRNSRDHRRWQSADDIYVPVSDGYLYAYDYKGRERWNRHVGNALVGAPVVIGLPDGREMVIVGSDWPVLHAFDRDGNPLWSLDLDKPAFGSPAVAHGRIYVATQFSLFALGWPQLVAPEGPLTGRPPRR